MKHGVIAALWLAGCASTEPEPAVSPATPAAPWTIPDLRDLAAYVNPMVGTKGPGNVVPGALVPHGFVRVGPDTDGETQRVDAYEWDDARIEGFTHTNLEGPGGSSYGYSQLLVMPVAGALTVVPPEMASAYSHDDEHASPGFYGVTLATGVKVELTATGHAAVHRYTFPEGKPAHVVFDLAHSLGQFIDGTVAVHDETTMSGSVTYQVHPALALLIGPDEPTGLVTVHFFARWDRPAQGSGTWNEATPHTDARSKLGAWLTFEPGATVELTLGLSLIDTATAQQNLDAEVAGRGFDAVRDDARRLWNERLNRIQVEGPEELQRRLYTALYHAMMQPSDATEAGGRYFSAWDGVGQVSTAEGWRYLTDDWCAWDTFRTSHPLHTLVEPEIVSDVVRSYLRSYEQGGWLEKCSWIGAGYSRVMIGNHAIAIIADAIVKGFKGFDLEAAWTAMMKTSTSDNANTLEDGGCGYLNLGTPPFYLSHGYVPAECDSTQSASMTLEYSYDDWCMAQVAATLGKTADEATFRERAAYWRNQWNPATGFMQPRSQDGSFVEPFDPANANLDSGFTEASAWIYTWFVPHDVLGLIEVVGGAATFVAKLDQFFDEGRLDISNEPSFHTPWLYNRAGAPEKAQQRVRAILDTAFGSGPDGLPGNDDAGATSAWYVLAALGLYPVAPGEPRWDLSTPLFRRATLHLHPDFFAGKTFVIETKGEGATIQSMTLNGLALDRYWLSQQEIVQGGTLVVTLKSEP